MAARWERRWGRRCSANASSPGSRWIWDHRHARHRAREQDGARCGLRAGARCRAQPLHHSRRILLDDAAVVQVDRDPVRLGGPAEVAVGIVADVGATVVAMTEMLDLAEHRPATGHPPDLAARLAARDPYAEFADSSGPDTLDVRTAMLELNRLLPSERVVVTDTGRFVYGPWRHLEVVRPTDFAHTCNFASIGLGLGTAIGAAVATGRLTVAVLGDGGGMMNLLGSAPQCAWGCRWW